jgi:hypothetical protein
MVPIKPKDSLEELAVMQDATPKNLEGQLKAPEWKEKMLRKKCLHSGSRRGGEGPRKRSMPKRQRVSVIHTSKG